MKCVEAALFCEFFYFCFCVCLRERLYVEGARYHMMAAATQPLAGCPQAATGVDEAAWSACCSCVLLTWTRPSRSHIRRVLTRRSGIRC